MWTPHVGFSMCFPLELFIPESPSKAFACSTGVYRSPHLRQLPSYLSVSHSRAILLRFLPFPSQGLCNSPPIFETGQVLVALVLDWKCPCVFRTFFCGQNLSPEAVNLSLLFRVSQSLSTLFFASCFDFRRNCCWLLVAIWKLGSCCCCRFERKGTMSA